MPYLRTLEVCSWQGAIQIHIYLTLPYLEWTMIHVSTAVAVQVERNDHFCLTAILSPSHHTCNTRQARPHWSLTYPWSISNSWTFPDFPGGWPPCIQSVNVISAESDMLWSGYTTHSTTTTNVTHSLEWRTPVLCVVSPSLVKHYFEQLLRMPLNLFHYTLLNA